jgi:acetyl-CoA synthetase
MTEQQLFPVSAQAGQQALIDARQYRAMYRYSIEQPEKFWAEQGNRIDWIKPFGVIKDTSFAVDDLHIQWYRDGRLNVSVNCLDRHLVAIGDNTALIWEPDNPDESHRQISYRELHGCVCKLANGLRALGVCKGDVVILYMPQIPETIVAMLACARIGAVHCVVFGGFSAEALADRIDDSKARWVITVDHSLRGGHSIPLKDNVDAALKHCSADLVDRVVVVQRSGSPVTWDAQRDIWYKDVVSGQAVQCEPEVMEAEDPLFILYTSGLAAKPSGLVHSCGGYLVYASLTHQYLFDYQPGDIYWCTADIGWIIGHSYVLYGPLANGATTVLHEGVPGHPHVGRWAQIIEKYKVTIFYTIPTAIRSLMAHGNQAVAGADLSSLRLLGSVGEPINPTVWRWFYTVFGRSQCPVVDTWWQTETGGIMIAPLPGATTLKPGSATLPFFGIEPALFDDKGNLVEGEGHGKLAIGSSWPGQARTIYGDHQRFIDSYFTAYPGYYFTGDAAHRDQDGYYWITGRVDDVINVSGHRLSATEIESALVSHPSVLEAAAVACPHAIKGHGLYVFVTLDADQVADDQCRQELVACLRRRIGAIAQPDVIQWAPMLPKTGTGEIMRRLLHQIACDDCDHLGDWSTLVDPNTLQQLIANRVRQAPSA